MNACGGIEHLGKLICELATEFDNRFTLAHGGAGENQFFHTGVLSALKNLRAVIIKA